MTSDESFPKREHILKTKDFMVVFKKGSSIKNGPFTIYYIRNGLGHSRLGISISARFIKQASKRNRIKRLIREMYRKNRKNMKIGTDIVLSIKRELPQNNTTLYINSLLLKLLKDSKVI